MKRNWEIAFYLAVLVLVNLSLLWQAPAQRLYYHPPTSDAFGGWQLLTHAFAHVSGYHAVLDGAAFLLLYGQLPLATIRQRTVLVAGCLVASLVGATLELSISSASSFCGLSGLTHGLMAVCALAMVRQREDQLQRRVGWLCLSGLLVKCAYETVSGHMLFEFMHAGQVGIPLVWSHAGGVGGGFLTYLLLQAPWRWPVVPQAVGHL